MSLEVRLAKEMKEAEGLVLNMLGFNSRPKELDKPKIIISDRADAAYRFDDAYVFSRDVADLITNAYNSSSDAIMSLHIKVHEAAHRVRFKLKESVRNYFLNPLNSLKEKVEDYIERINLEESFAKYAEDLALYLKGLNSYYSPVLSKIKNSVVKLFNVPYQIATHAFGYASAKELYQNKIAGGFEKLVEGFKYLFHQTNPREVGIPKIELQPA